MLVQVEHRPWQLSPLPTNPGPPHPPPHPLSCALTLCAGRLRSLCSRTTSHTLAMLSASAWPGSFSSLWRKKLSPSSAHRGQWGAPRRCQHQHEAGPAPLSPCSLGWRCAGLCTRQLLLVRVARLPCPEPIYAMHPPHLHRRRTCGAAPPPRQRTPPLGPQSCSWQRTARWGWVVGWGGGGAGVGQRAGG